MIHAIALFTLVSSAFAGDGPSVLEKMDAATNNYEDQIIDWRVVDMQPGKKEAREMAFQVHIREGKALTSFSEPADVDGTRILVLSRTNMFIYMPDFGKMRRIASHVTQQGFMGTSYSHSDMSADRFGDIYDAKLASETDEAWVLELSPKEEAKNAPYAKVMATVSKENNYPLKFEYFNDKGDHVKTETRSDYECESEFCLAKVMRMEDHTREGAWTELRREGWELNSDFSDDILTQRTLQRGL